MFSSSERKYLKRKEGWKEGKTCGRMGGRKGREGRREEGIYVRIHMDYFKQSLRNSNTAM